MKKVAVYTGSRNLYPMMVPAVKSLLRWSSVDEIWLFIEDDAFPEWLPECVHVRNVSGQAYFPPGSANMRSDFTYFALMRAALCHEFPDLDVILSLDVDTVCVGDMDAVWDIDLGDCYFAASIEPLKAKEGLMYCNTGVSLYNLKRLRESGKADEVIGALNRQQFTFVEQDAFSYLCQGWIAQMPSMFNANEYVIPHGETRLVHWAGYKDWTDKPEYVEASKLEWEDVLKGRR